MIRGLASVLALVVLRLTGFVVLAASQHVPSGASPVASPETDSIEALLLIRVCRKADHRGR